jgi:hypothetical protein
MSLFQKGFRRFAKSGALSDLTLVHCPNQNTANTYHVHRIVLAYSSDFFRTLLSSDFKEKRQLTIQLNFPDPLNVFPKILQFMYQGCLDISLKNVVALLTQADHYLMPQLLAQCREFINKHLTRSNVIKVEINIFCHFFHTQSNIHTHILSLSLSFTLCSVSVSTFDVVADGCNCFQSRRRHSKVCGIHGQSLFAYECGGDGR